MSFTSENPWIILSSIELAIKQKIESMGRPLKEWDINIYRGVLTGCNEAFIIDGKTRATILENCKTDEERTRTDEVIRPILRGRDICKFSYNWADLWLINTHNGVKGHIDRIDILDYPAVKEHLDSLWEKIESRADQGDTPYNLRNCAYLDDFNRPKILWKRIGSILRFSYDNSGKMGLDSTCFATGHHLEYLCCVLNSRMGRYILQDAPKTGTGDLLISVQAVEPVHVPIVSDEINRQFEQLLNQAIQTNLSEDVLSQIDTFVYDQYGLSEDERKYIDSLPI